MASLLIGDKCGCTRQITHMADGRDDRSSLDWANDLHGKQNLSLARVLNNVTDFCIKLLKMLLQQFQLFHHLLLLKNETALPAYILRADTLSSKLLQAHQVFI